MQKLVVHITAPGIIDENVAVRIASLADLGRAVHAALDIVLSTQRAEFGYPLFIDIHPADEFQHVEHFYAAGPKRPAGAN